MESIIGFFIASNYFFTLASLESRPSISRLITLFIDFVLPMMARQNIQRKCYMIECQDSLFFNRNLHGPNVVTYLCVGNEITFFTPRWLLIVAFINHCRMNLSAFVLITILPSTVVFTVWKETDKLSSNRFGKNLLQLGDIELRFPVNTYLLFYVNFL